MIVQETKELDGITFILTYSNTNKKIVGADGYLYAEAMDPADVQRVYNESDEDLYSAQEIADFQKHLAGLNK